MALQTTPLFAAHQEAGARMVEFAGWSMPLHYGSQLDEHHAVRQHAGVFDVSHMRAIDVAGEGATAYLRCVLANDVAKLTLTGRALYTCMLNSAGGILDDLLVYQRGDLGYRIVVNAATTESDLAHLVAQSAGFAVTLTPRNDLAMLAIQGPRALTATLPLLSPMLRVIADRPAFHALWEQDWMVARTGYTGEDGVEVLLPASEAVGFWSQLLDQGVRPAGLGARDTLRLEAGLNLYGTDMDTTTTPMMANLGWTVAWEPTDRDFIGRSALVAQREQGVPVRQVGLVLTDRGILRGGMIVTTDVGPGVITSGSFAPTLGYSVALARVPADVNMNASASVALRGRDVPVRLVKPGFVRHGQSLLT